MVGQKRGDNRAATMHLQPLKWHPLPWHNGTAKLSVALALSAHTPWVQLKCLLLVMALGIRMQAHAVGTWPTISWIACSNH